MKIIDDLILREGGFTNDPDDPGGPTKYGITQKTYSDFIGRPVTVDEMRDLTPEQAAAVYTKKYIGDPGFDKVLAISDAIGEEVIDSGVNCGVEESGRWLQQCLNALNRQGRDYADIAEDGACGAGTIAALHTYLQKRQADGELVMVRYLNALQGAYYITISQKHKNLEDYVFGWGLNRLAGL